jgi:hypothetical protein
VRRGALLILLLLLTLGSLRAQDFAATHYALLSGDNISPAPSGSAQGLMLLSVDPVGMKVQYVITLIDPTSAITSASFITGDPATELRPFTFPSGKHTATGTLEGLTAENIQAFATGLVAARVSTTDNPGGEVLGWIEPFANAAATLRPITEVPPVQASDGSGQMEIILSVPTRALYYNLTWSDLSGRATAAHFHKGAFGVAGDPVQGITVPVEDVNSNSATGAWTGLTDQQMADIIAGNYYVNVHTAMYPNGEIRGQIYPVNYYTAAATLTGGSTPVSTGYLRAVMDPAEAEISGSFFIDGTSEAINAAHIVVKPDNDVAFELNSGLSPSDWEAFYFIEADSVTAWAARGMSIDFETSGVAASGMLRPAATNLSLASSGVGYPIVTPPSVPFNAYYDRSAGVVAFHLPDASLLHEATVTLYSPLGEQVAVARVDERGGNLQVGALPAGIYFARLASDGTPLGVCRVPVVH